MLSKIVIDGYKSIDKEELELEDFTLLSGINSAGKTSVIQAILFMLHMQRKCGNEKRDTGYDIGKFTDIRNNIKGNREIVFELSSRVGEITEVSTASVMQQNGVTVSIFETAGSEEADYTKMHNIIYLSVERVGVMRTYELNTGNTKEIGERGEYAYSYLASWGQEPIPEEAFAYEPEKIGMSLNNQVNFWLEYLMGFRVQTNIIQEVDQVVVTYANAKNNRYYRGKNVGTGITYMAILIIAALTCKKDDTIIIENPEIHLHPRAQSRFMEFLAFLSDKGLQIIVETHSDHIYNGMRKCIKKGTLKKEKVAAYFLELDDTMQTRVERIRLNEQGAEENHPYGMFDQFDDDLDELLGL